MSRQVKALREYPARPRGEGGKIQKLGVHSVKRKKWRQSAAVERQMESTEDGVEGLKPERAQAREVSLKPWQGRTASLEEEGCISYAQAALSASNTWSAADAAASLQQLQKASGGGLSVSYIGNARVAGCCDASVAPWRFGSGGAAHVLHTCRSLKQICATAGPIAAASSLELGAVR